MQSSLLALEGYRRRGSDFKALKEEANRYQAKPWGNMAYFYQARGRAESANWALFVIVGSRRLGSSVNIYPTMHSSCHDVTF